MKTFAATLLFATALVSARDLPTMDIVEDSEMEFPSEEDAW